MYPKDLLQEIRNKFCHVDTCPFSGERIFFENAGGSLTLKSVAKRSGDLAAIPDNQGRDNRGSQGVMDLIKKSKADALEFFDTEKGSILIGESGTELLFRLIRSAILASDKGTVVGSTLEHPASRSASTKWAAHASKELRLVQHCKESGSVKIDQYLSKITQDVGVATIVHTSPVTGIGVEIKELTQGIKSISPDCFIIVDGIQHAPHGDINIRDYPIDGYVISPYKVFSRHGYGLAWISDRLRNLPHENLMKGPKENWDLGTRDVGSYATFSDVVNYFEWLGSRVSNASTRREKFAHASKFIKLQEQKLVKTMLYGKDNVRGLSDYPKIKIIGGLENELREGLVSFSFPEFTSDVLVKELNSRGIRTHVRKSDHYSANILEPLGLESCVRVSMCHYNSEDEVIHFLTSMSEIMHQ
ncbi:MAG: nitrogen fixation protein NifS [Rhodobacteraceae bacterium]|nr:MAG: nitrogen fixation protein NifS [Paracoccaceae bacterium]